MGHAYIHVSTFEVFFSLRGAARPSTCCIHDCSIPIFGQQGKYFSHLFTLISDKSIIRESREERRSTGWYPVERQERKGNMTTATPQRQSTPKPAKVAKLHQHPDTGEIHALSSDGVTRYLVTLGDDASCTCPGFTHHGRCYHLATALQRFPAFYSRPAAVIVPEPDPEPPTPAAPAVLPARCRRCQAALYPDCDCDACNRRLAA
jgi:hypothetical protein